MLTNQTKSRRCRPANRRAEGADRPSEELKGADLTKRRAQGTDQPDYFTDADIKKYSNPFQIVKDRYQVNGSQATNVGWVNLGGGDYRWFMYGEQEEMWTWCSGLGLGFGLGWAHALRLQDGSLIS